MLPRKAHPGCPGYMEPRPLSPGTGTSSSRRSSSALMFSGVRAGKAESGSDSSEVVSLLPDLRCARLSRLLTPLTFTKHLTKVYIIMTLHLGLPGPGRGVVAAVVRQARRLPAALPRPALAVAHIYH